MQPQHPPRPASLLFLIIQATETQSSLYVHVNEDNSPMEKGGAKLNSAYKAGARNRLNTCALPKADLQLQLLWQFTLNRH